MPSKKYNKIISRFKKIENSFLDLIFPKSCILCNRENSFLCQKCLKKIELLSLQVCPVCERNITDGGKVCRNCRNHPSSVNQIVVATDYQKSEISKIIHDYKYNFVQELHVPLGKILLKAIIKNNCPTPDFIVPVPLHSHRLRWRGFNQSGLLANYLSRNLLPGIKIPVLSDLVLRVKNTSPQMKIKKYSQRQKNLENAFSLNNLKNLKNRKVLLVDDVCTTGSTIFECAKIIQGLNPASICGVVLGRQK